MNHTRRDVLRTASALSALAVGASTTASAADCSGVPDWDAGATYGGGDQVVHDGTLWTAEWWTQSEPDASQAVWTDDGACDGGGENEAPVASFSTDVSTPDPGQAVGFDAGGSSDPDGSIGSYDWAFGDGSSATGQTASHSYGSAGDYTVTLTVTDDAGATDDATTTVSVSDGNGNDNEAPDASFTVSPSSPTAGEAAEFDAADSSDADGSIASYAWEFGDGSSASGQTASHAFDAPGDYTVTLTVTDDDGATDANATTVTVQESGGGGGTDCSGVPAWTSSDTYTGGDQVTHDDSLWTAEWWTSGTEPAASENVWTEAGECGGGGGGGNESPSASFTVSPSDPAPGDSITFDASGSSDPDGSISSYAWDFTGDGTDDASGQSASHSYEDEGTYTVSLTVTDDAGATATDSTTVSVQTDGGGSGSTPVMAYSTSGNAPTDQVSHVMHSFGSVSSDGSISAPWNAGGSDPDTTYLLALGGWGHGDGFPNAAADQSSRERFASDCVEIMRTNDLDGIDLDWEYPGPFGPDGQQSYPDDPQNFTTLIEECRSQFDQAGQEDGKEYLLTSALSGHVEHLEVLEHEQIMADLDYAMVMSYDYHSPVFVDRTNHNSPLYSSSNAPTDKSIHNTLSYLRDQGWANEQLALGMAFYGRTFNQVGSSDNDGLFQSFSSAGSAVSYTDLPDPSSSNYTRYWDDEAKVPWLFDGSSLISYDDDESVTAKASYANERGHPVMYWETGHDPNGTLATAVDEELNGQ